MCIRDSSTGVLIFRGNSLGLFNRSVYRNHVTLKRNYMLKNMKNRHKYKFLFQKLYFIFHILKKLFAHKFLYAILSLELHMYIHLCIVSCNVSLFCMTAIEWLRYCHRYVNWSFLQKKVFCIITISDVSLIAIVIFTEMYIWKYALYCKQDTL